MNYIDLSITVIGLVAIAGFLWNLARDMRAMETRMLDKIEGVETRMMNEMRSLINKTSELGERVAKIEGALFETIPGLGQPESK